MNDPVTLTPATAYTQEVRFAVVMYGGVSLAIYMNGIAQELLKLVRATAPAPGDTSLSTAYHTDAELADSERVYRKLGRLLARGVAPPATLPEQIDGPIATRFVVDILTGTSAGGINAVFLAKALANDQSITSLKELWVGEGDIGRLINDGQAVADLPIDLVEPPRSPLSGDRMYLKLLQAFDGMDRGPEDGGTRSPNLDELDLFVTTTDVRGWRTALAADDSQPDERRYKTVFQLRYSAIDDTPPGALGTAKEMVKPPDRNDFVPANNPFLAFIARCTSAHQAAFQPMRLSDVNRLVAAHPAYRGEPWVRAGAAEQPWRELYPRIYTDQPRADGGNAFFERDFADGGVLDNRPFGYVLETLPTRRSQFPVVRKLLFVDPAPEQFSGIDLAQSPDYLENGLTALTTIRGYETIREDLEALRRHNQRAAQVAALVAALEADLGSYDLPAWQALIAARPASARLRASSLRQLAGAEDLTWPTYLRLRAAPTAVLLAHMLARAAGIADRSPHYAQLRAAVSAWAERRYGDDSPAAGRTLVAFLLDFDADWHLRRLRRALDALDELALYGGRGQGLAAVAQRYSEAHGLGPLADLPAGLPDEAFRARAIELRRALSMLYTRLREGRARLMDEGPDNPLAATVRAHGLPALLDAQGLNPGLPYEQLANHFQLAMGGAGGAALNAALDGLILGGTPAEARPDDLLASLILTGDPAPPRPIPAEPGSSLSLQAALAELLIGQQGELYSLLGIADDPAAAPAPINDPLLDTGTAISVARFAVLEFERYDRVVYPLVAASGIGDELDAVEIFRVSPLDAPALVDERRAGSKLAGTSLRAFGAFFERKFRVNDIMWGRLDGAERIITALLPGSGQATLRAALIAEAHAAILREEYFAPRGQVPGGDGEAIAGFRRAFAEERTELRRLDGKALAENVSRLSRVLGKLFDSFNQARPAMAPLWLWINRALAIVTAVIDAALAQSLRGLLSRYWLTVVYLFALLQILLGALFGSPAMQSFGTLVGAVALGAQLLVLITRDMLAGRRRWQAIGAVVAGLLVLGAAVGAGIQASRWLAGSGAPAWLTGLAMRLFQPGAPVGVVSALVFVLAIAGVVVASRDP